jgi:hypothetical protein
MKNIQYYSIANGAYAWFDLLENIPVEVINEDFKWAPAKFDLHHNPERPNVIIPTWELQFDSILHLVSYLVGEMNRDGYYVIAGRNCEEDSRYDFLYQGDQLSSYFSCFGVAYYPTPFIKNPHQKTGTKKDPLLPDWLKDLNPLLYQISK